jgi:predicted O-methyltransferase YrrM
MAVVAQLMNAYAAEGFQIATGLNSTFYGDLFTAPFTRLIRNGQSISDGYGISLQELWFLEALAAVSPASSVLVIGNSFGWSTLGLALAHPDATVVAIDAGLDEYSIEGIELTNALAGRLGVQARAVRGRSPEDVPPNLAQAGLTSLDWVLIDGMHTSAQLAADWTAVLPYLAERSIVLCHDVLMLQLETAFAEIATSSPGWQADVLHATTSGIGVLHRGQPAGAVELLRALSIGESARGAVTAEASESAGIAGFRYWQEMVAEHHQLHG